MRCSQICGGGRRVVGWEWCQRTSLSVTQMFNPVARETARTRAPCFFCIAGPYFVTAKASIVEPTQKRNAETGGIYSAASDGQ